MCVRVYVCVRVCVCVTEPALRHHRGGDLPEGADPVRGLAGGLSGHAGQEGPGRGTDEASQT